MGWAKRGSVLADFIYRFIYVGLTFAVVLNMVFIPARMIDASLQTYKLDAAIMEQRILAQLDRYDHALGTQHGVLTTTPQKAEAFSFSEKAFAYKVKIGTKEYHGNKKFFRDSKPLTPVRYDLISTSEVYLTDTQPAVVTIEQVYPPRYERLKT